VGRYQKGKTNLDSTGAREVSGSGISLAICKSATQSRQITTPALHYSSFLQAGCPSCRPTNSVKALKASTVSALVIKSLYYVNGSMWGSRRNKIYPCGNPVIIRSIPMLFPQHSYPHPRETHGFCGIPAVPIPMHTSTGCVHFGPTVRWSNILLTHAQLQ